uniref:Uncharacterized protein n=1 Tax=Cyprinus carpio carpio TaxID=630221 RepID=A0A9J8B5D8_CYPCA
MADDLGDKWWTQSDTLDSKQNVSSHRREQRKRAIRSPTKTRKKKKTITDVLTSSEPVPGSPADLLSLLKSHHSQTRSVTEQEELTLSVCLKWAKIQKQHTQTRSVVCSSFVDLL